MMQEDLYYPQTFVQDLFWKSVHMFSENILNRWPFKKLIRERAIRRALELIHYHDEATQYITGGGVPKVNGIRIKNRKKNKKKYKELKNNCKEKPKSYIERL